MKARRTALAPLLLVLLAPLPAAAGELTEAVDTELPALLETYRHLHANPEISYLERETSRFVAERLRQLGFTVTEGVGDYGVEGRASYGLVAVLANGDGPTVMVRTDLDGLPVEEKTGLPYASRARQTNEAGAEVFTMHACGHDLHMTSFLGTAAMLAGRRDEWSGTLVMIGQPAEERGAGARAMLDAGLYERFPRPDVALALHTNASLAAGRIGLVPGYALANVDSVDITVRGAGGHGAYPHTTRDPVTLAALIVTNLQTIVSRQVSPLEPAVITVGSIHGGTKHNIIPDEVELQLTVRSYKPEVRRYLLESIRRTAEQTARAAGFPDELLPVVTLHEEEYTPSTYNDPELVERLTGVFSGVLGEEAVLRMTPVMGGEGVGDDGSGAGPDGSLAVVPVARAVVGVGRYEPLRCRLATARPAEGLDRRRASGVRRRGRPPKSD
jgi:hippurate hydrolase